MLSLLLIISIFLYITAPEVYSLSSVVISAIIYVLCFIHIIQNNCRFTFVKYEFFFFIAIFFTCYVYPLFFYTENPYFSFFTYAFNENLISKATALATVGVAAFSLGVCEKTKVFASLGNSYVEKKLNFPNKSVLFLMMLFIPQLFKYVSMGVYTTDFESSLVNVVLQYLIYYFLFAYFYNERSFHPKKITYIHIAILLYVILFLLIGSRTLPLRIALFILLLYSIYVKPIQKLFILTIMFGGVLLLYIVGMVRMGEEVSLTNIWDVGFDLIINNRNLYVLMDYANTHGYTWGESMLMSFLSIIPFGQSTYLKLTGSSLSDISSGNLVTDLHYGKRYAGEEITGFGTNIFGDIYLAFGLIGVIVLMFLLGRFLRTLYQRASEGNRISVLIYALLFVDVVYSTRSTYWCFLRTIVWTYSIFYLYNRIIHRKIK